MEAGIASLTVLGLCGMLGGVESAQEPGLARGDDDVRGGGDDVGERSSVHRPAIPILFSRPAAS